MTTQAFTLHRFPLVYDELRALARRLIHREQNGHTLQPTALVHETYMRLATQRNDAWDSHSSFYRAAASMLRRVVINYEERRRAIKRGGTRTRETLCDSIPSRGHESVDVIVIDDLLHALSGEDARQAKIVELRLFGGLGIKDIADTLRVSTRTVDGELAHARAWIRRRLQRGNDE